MIIEDLPRRHIFGANGGEGVLVPVAIEVTNQRRYENATLGSLEHDVIECPASQAGGGEDGRVLDEWGTASVGRGDGCR
jgi:hypothetical protein